MFRPINDWIRPGERVDDLQRDGYRILQNPQKPCFGLDAVLLSDFTHVKRGETVLDLGTGTGILPILLAAKTEGQSFTGLEIQKALADMARRSIGLNALEERITVEEGDLREASVRFGRAAFDVVVSNPPYMKEDQGRTSPHDARALTRHEIACTLEDVVRETARVLRVGGRFDLVHRPGRLGEIFEALHRHRLEPRRMRLVYPYADREANLVLLEAVRGGKPGMKVEAPLIIYREPGCYTREMCRIYGLSESI
ncbi:MAG: tRNA1(Val) (adenine(37)-N6)-methyltransferase [Lachnospiraceae bacterium]|nr:tRNA1(Val) (adenine(37)-N6)-methyltransferase [Lachnospiraceae bacterium]